MNIQTLTRFAAIANFTGFTLVAVANAGIVPVTGITGHDGGNFSPTLGHLTDMVNATNIGWATADHNPGITTSAAPNFGSTTVAPGNPSGSPAPA